MALPASFWPASGNAARGIALAPYKTGVAIGDWTTPTVWPFAGGAFAAGVVLSSGTPGLSAIATDGASGLWALSYAGALFHLSSGGVVVASPTMPSGVVYVGVSPSGHALSSAGRVLTSAATTLGTWPASAPGPLLATGSTLIANLPASGIGLMNGSTGVTGLIALPAGMTTLSCLATSSGALLAAAGWATAPVLSGSATAALNPTDATAMVGVGSGRAVLWRSAAALSDAWTQTQALTGLANLSAMAWAPDGFQILAPSVASGAVQVLGYAAGVLSLLQTLTVSGACGVAVTGDSLHALIAQSGQSQLATAVFSGGVWVSGAPITGFPGITQVAPLGAASAVVAYTSSLALLAITTGTWSITSSAALGFTPAQLAVDSFSQIYAAGPGLLAVVSSGLSVLASGSWTGGASPSAIAIQQGRLALAIPASSGLYLYGQSAPGLWTQQASGALVSGAAVGLGLSDTTLFVCASAATQTYGFSGSPFVPTNVLSGIASQWNGSSWTSTTLGVGHSPSACGYDASGQLNVVTTQNNQWVIATGGTAVSSGIVPQYSGQVQTVPLGLSALYAFSSGLYAATSIPGILMAVV